MYEHNGIPVVAIKITLCTYATTHEMLTELGSYQIILTATLHEGLAHLKCYNHQFF